ncbi:hypothetical protein ACLPHM_05080 [Paenalcaligenes sp. Me131]|uniref:hypothetical protein n=1 Tax=Paenalcaligenes sp. Me131 TaxID=3392636 RepID=UPI003D2DFC85
MKTNSLASSIKSRTLTSTQRWLIVLILLLPVINVCMIGYWLYNGLSPTTRLTLKKTLPLLVATGFLLYMLFLLIVVGMHRDL